MKIACSSCKNLLTMDLYPVKASYDSYGYLIATKKLFNERKEYFHGKVIKKGIFFLTKEFPAYSWTDEDVYGDDTDSYTGYHSVIKKEKSKIVVSKDSILEGVIPPNPTNCCCNWSSKPLICKCGKQLGFMFLDCYEDGSVRFDLKSIDRVYNS